MIHLRGLAKDYTADQTIPAHHHAEHQLVHGLDGVMRVSTETAMWILPPGRALWVPGGTSHALRCIGPVRLRTVYLGGTDARFPPRPVIGSVSGLMRELMVRIADTPAEAQLPHLAALLIDEIDSMRLEPWSLPINGNGPSARLARHWIEDPADTRPLPVWADHLAISPRSLIRKIKAETGLSFRELRRQARILAAIERLSGPLPITEIALQVGFDSASAFTYAFRLSTGLTPSAFREQTVTDRSPA